MTKSLFDDGPGPDAGVAQPRLTGWNPEEWPVADDWRPVIERFLASEPAQKLGQFMRDRLAARATIYPPQPFRALALTPMSELKVLILGQDPYHGPSQAEGLAFSVAPGVRPPPSLRNIFKEVARDGGSDMPANGSLVRWAQQGVLLLNTCLTVEQGQPASHARQGWEVLTDEIIKAVSSNGKPVVFMLWGAHAQAKRGLVADDAGKRHLVLTANHPSPLAALRPPQPFMGSAHFGLANAFLQRHGGQAIKW